MRDGEGTYQVGPNPSASPHVDSSSRFPLSTKSLAALLSVENIFYTPNAAREKASAARRKFLSREGDHATLLSTFRSHQRVKGAKQWCYDNFINVRSMKTVLATRDQVGRRRMVPGAIFGLHLRFTRFNGLCRLSSQLKDVAKKQGLTLESCDNDSEAYRK